MICFSTGNCVADSTSSWTGGALGPPWTRAIAALGASPELSLRSLRGSRSPAKGAGRQGRGQGTIWWPHLAPVGGEEATRRRGVAAAGARWWGRSREAGRGRGGAREAGILGLLYIGQGDEVKGQGRKSGGRRWVFITGRFETEKEREGRCSCTA
jgi:hypothetical protein